MMIQLLHGNYRRSVPPSFFLPLIESIFLKSQTVSTAEVLRFDTRDALESGFFVNATSRYLEVDFVFSAGR